MPLTIGQLARETAVGLETLRFYEREGLIDDPPRTEAGYRQYPEEAIARIRFIRRTKELGFSLKEISSLLSLRVDPERSSADVKRQAEEKIADIEEKIRDLRRMKKALEQLTAACCGQGPISKCPILEALTERD